MEQDSVRYPLVFVTGVGQTWTSLHGNDRVRWNLFARDKDVVFGGLSGKERLRLLRGVREIAHALLTDKKADQTALRAALTTLLRFCIVDDDGRLPDCAEVHIYGTRSFDELSRVDFFSGEPTQDASKSLLDRLLRDVPCRDFMREYGAENMYCFNYSPFTDLYAAADALHETLRGIVQKRREDKVVLIPMSMGAAVTLAYLDAYYTDRGPVRENFIRRIVSVVGAWDGSEGFADLLRGSVCPQWNARVYDELLPAQKLPPALLRLLTRRPDRTNALLRQLLDALLDGVLMRSSAFLALVPHARWQDMYAYLFSPERFRQNSRLAAVQQQADRFIRAQENRRAHMREIFETCGIRFSFVGGTGLKPGEESSDFQFMRLLACADRTDTDGVLQLGSSMPFDQDDPESFVQAFAVFDRQMHEIGGNADAMRLIFDLAVGRSPDRTHCLRSFVREE
ncbi:MAG: hypothetical protein IJT44_03255 [Clostridia bacterium]|nr:hypothetical protein [Clostridia bacterium]